jgi:hypothetical protein
MVRSADVHMGEFLSGHDPVIETLIAAHMAAIGPELGEEFLTSFLRHAEFSHPSNSLSFCHRVRDRAAFLRSQ